MANFKDLFKIVPEGSQASVDLDSVLKRIADDISANKLVLYMKGTPQMPQCGFSAATVGVLEKLGTPYIAYDVLAEPGLREAIKQYSDWPTIPQVYVNGEFIGGCDIVHELYERGELQKMLEGA